EGDFRRSKSALRQEQRLRAGPNAGTAKTNATRYAHFIIIISRAIGIKTVRAPQDHHSWSGGELAGAEGFEPSPSSLTVRCPTSWTTPQRAIAGNRLAARLGVVFAEKRARSISLRYHGAHTGPNRAIHDFLKKH